jgi:3-deoxy-D-manno-octulosonic-acid transferase
MRILYTIGILLYGFTVRIASLFNQKAKFWIEGRKDFFSKMPDVKDRSVYWFHCASLGEFDQALPVINLLKEKNPSVYILITFFSPSGYLHFHKRNHKADYVCYLPLDLPSNAKKFITHFKPEKVFFVKYEFWANYIFEAKKSGAKLYSISALFRSNHRFFKKNNHFFKSVLQQFDHFFVQNKFSANLLKTIQIESVTITGDTRFDRVIENKNNLQKNKILELFLNEQKAFIIGSSWPVDEELILSIIQEKSFSEKTIIAPHDISENHILQIISKISIPFIRFSDMEKGKIPSNEKIIILDTIGHLASAYSYGTCAYIGGGFTGNLHNILEPAVFGLPVIFGPKHSRFPEAEMFIQEGIGFSIENKEQFISSLNEIKLNASNLSVKTSKFVENQRGASEKIMHYLKQN